MDVETAVKEFIQKEFLAKRDAKEVSENDSLLDSGLIDSTGIFEIVGFLETRFEIEVADEDIIPENFETMKDIVGFINARQQR